MIYAGQHIVDDKKRVKLLVCHVDLALKTAAVTDLGRIEGAENIPKPALMKFSALYAVLRSPSATSAQYEFDAELSLSDDAITQLGKQNWLKKRDKKYTLIAPLTTEVMIRQYLYRDGIAEDVRQLIDTNRQLAIPGAWSTKGAYYHALNRFIVFGCTRNALLPVKLKNVGKNTHLPAKIGDKNIKRGRGGADNRFSRSKSMGVTEQHKAQMRATIAFMKSKDGKIQYPKFAIYKAIELYQYNFESTVIERTVDNVTTETRIPFDEEHSLSEAQLRYHYKQILDRTEYLKIRYGHIAYEKDHADRQGSSHDGVLGATFRYEVDATVLDKYIRYPFDNTGQYSMGRPVLYIVIDVFSTAIVGMYVGFDGPNWAGASQALVNACSDKVAFAAQFGVTITEDEWPCHHVPVEITVDNGREYPDGLIESVLRTEIGVRGFNFTAVFRGDAKAVVEKKFDVLNKGSLHFSPGAIPEAPQRGEQHPSNQALLDDDSLVAELIHTIVLHNNSADRLHRLDINAIRAGIDITPISLFKHSLTQEMNGGRDAKKEEQGRLQWAFLPEETASVRSDGIYFDGLVYYSDYAKKAGWFTKAKHHGSFKIPVKRWRQWTTHLWHKTLDGQYVCFNLKNVNDESPFIDQHWEPVLHLLEQFKDKRHENRLNLKKLRIAKQQYSQELIRLNQQIIASAPDNTRVSMSPRIKELQRQYAAVQHVKHALEIHEQLANENSTASPLPNFGYDDIDNELFGD